MIKFTFKDVGQGDSIIIEWEDDTKGIAIVDCNLYKGKNVVIEHIIKENIKHIDLIVLSHPHYDHFSGMFDLLSYCLNNKITINRFYHTCDVVPDRLRSAVKGKYINTELHKLFKFIVDNSKKMNIKTGSISSDLEVILSLSKDYKLSFLSPSNKEINDFIRGSVYNLDEESDGNNPKANVLSTVIKVETPEGYILLTADTPKTSLVRIDIRTPDEIKGTLLLGQAPHHGAGSSVNHSNAFWKKRNRKNQTPIVFSVGSNGYGHVSKDPVDFFITNDYDLYATNQEGALTSISTRNISTALNAYSLLLSPKNGKFQGDQIFQFK